MNIIKKSDRYRRYGGYYRLDKNEIMGELFELEHVAEYLGLSNDLMEWATANKRCSGAVLCLTDDEMKKWARYNQYSKNMPEAAKQVLDTWEIRNKSPYSDSFYNANGIDWHTKPEGHLRLSDHWGWENDDGWHCEIENVVGYVKGWKLCQYINGRYQIITEF